MPTHSSLTGANVHEPKHIESANAGEVYVANGSGGGTWTPQASAVGVPLTVTIDDISTAGSVWIVSPISGNITRIDAIVDGAVSAADTTVSFEISGTPIVDGDITISSPSVAGNRYAALPSSANAVVLGNAIQVITDGASTGTVKATFTMLITQ